MTDLQRLIDFNESLAADYFALSNEWACIPQVEGEHKDRPEMHAETARIFSVLLRVRDGCDIQEIESWEGDQQMLMIVGQFKSLRDLAELLGGRKSELKPCQCGAPAFAEKKAAYGVGWWRIECTSCGIQTREEQDYSQVVAAWNTRATDAELERLREDAEILNFLAERQWHMPDFPDDARCYRVTVWADGYWLTSEKATFRDAVNDLMRKVREG